MGCTPLTAPYGMYTADRTLWDLHSFKYIIEVAENMATCHIPRASNILESFVLQKNSLELPKNGVDKGQSMSESKND